MASHLDSIPDNASQPGFHHIQSQDQVYHMRGNGNSLYNNSLANNLISPLSEYQLDVDLQNQHLAGKMPPGAFRNSFNALPNTLRPRNNTQSTSMPPPSSFREGHGGFYDNVFPPQLMSPTQELQQFEARPSFDFGNGHVGNGGYKQAPFTPRSDSFMPTGFMPPSSKSTAQQQQAPINMPRQQSAPFGNGVQFSSQTPFGPHIPSQAGIVNGAGANMPPPPGVGSLAAPVGMASGGPSVAPGGQEDISTIFVVGFPEDMQEREFQNMFTFSAGFEAATLKIPNKEFNAYGGGANNNSVAQQSRLFGASQDPYNNVDARDGWSSNAPAEEAGGQGHFVNGGNNAPTRKQIIGFAKFRTRDEALQARDILQGRRVDIEKGAVLKAEMAKKNLHTKRGVGPIPANAAQGPNALPQGMLHPTGMLQQPMMNGHPIEQVVGREREMSLSGVGAPRMSWRDNAADANAINAMAMANATTRGARERAEEEERERRRRDQDMRMRAGNSSTFDPFHSIPQDTPPTGFNPLDQAHWGDDLTTQGAWDAPRREGYAAAVRPPSDRSSGQTSPNSQANGTLPCASRSRTSSVTEESQRSGSGTGGDADLVQGLGDFALSNRNGNTSPQLPSPASGASGSTRNGVDQYPPINTLYVGNLPTSPPPGQPPDILRSRLTDLFRSQSGFSRISFNPKSTGLMCFVEFRDVHFATRAMHELYGHNVDGLVKGNGIRLSYSKNPFGVRTPTSADSSGPSLQQQQQHPNGGMVADAGDDLYRRESAPYSPTLGFNPIPGHPRIFSTSSSFGSNGPASPNAFTPRSGLYAFNNAPAFTQHTFSPFGLPHSPGPDSESPDSSQPVFGYGSIPPSTPNLEATGSA